jgi:O-antigen biosynthesis protein
MFNTPVAGRGWRGDAGDPAAARAALGLDDETPVALYMGSLADWSGARHLLQSTRVWRGPWRLVLHERFGAHDEVRRLVNAYADPARIVLSEQRYQTPEQLAGLIRSAALGVALYTPTFESPWVGRNIAHIGLASGKIASYLQHGVPVATHGLGEISMLIGRYGAGQLFTLDRPFVPQLPAAGGSARCRRLFEQHLDMERFAPALLDLFNRPHRAVASGE